VVVGAERSLVIDESCGPLRRGVGPVAWSVLEELVLLGDIADGTFVANVSLRTLARRLGLSKDTINRAMLRLRAAGLVTCGAHPDDTGRFAAGSYRVDLLRVPIRRIDVDPAPMSTDPASRARRSPMRQSHRRQIAATQLELLEAD
jgi:DNA-binding transcriptional MocR family regulator